MQPDRLSDYVAEIRGLAQDHTDSIELPLSLEVDYIPGVMGPHSAHVRSCGLDYVIGSVHFVDVLPDGTGWEIDGSSTVFRHGLEHLFGGDIRAAVSRYFAITRQMLAEDRPDVVGHIDKIKMQNTDFGLFDPAARWYRDELAQTLEAVAGSGCIMEVNTRGLYRGRTAFPYPGPWALRMARRLHVPVHLSSDAHRPDEITAEFGTAARMLMAAGYTECRIFLHGRWQDVQITHNGYMQ
jgi:histidinol-phosphatase (PHP family)